jgi:RES domain-containing protein
MKIYRTCLRRFDVTDPGGAIFAEGRWHAEGTPVLYCADSLALSVLEQCVNGNPVSHVRDLFHFADVETGEVTVETTPEDLYSGDWRSQESKTRDFGVRWIREGRTAILRVRSAALTHEWNSVLNTAHPDFERIRFYPPKPVPLDPRF